MQSLLASSAPCSATLRLSIRASAHPRSVGDCIIRVPAVKSFATWGKKATAKGISTTRGLISKFPMIRALTSWESGAETGANLRSRRKIPMTTTKSIYTGTEPGVESCQIKLGGSFLLYLNMNTPPSFLRASAMLEANLNYPSPVSSIGSSLYMHPEDYESEELDPFLDHSMQNQQEARLRSTMFGRRILESRELNSNSVC